MKHFLLLLFVSMTHAQATLLVTNPPNWNLPPASFPSAGQWGAMVRGTGLTLDPSRQAFREISETEILLNCGSYFLCTSVRSWVNHPTITSLSFDWDFSALEEPTVNPVLVKYQLDDQDYDLVSGYEIAASGSVLLTNLDVRSFGYSFVMESGSGTLRITNLDYSVVPEPASMILLVFAFAAFMCMKMRIMSNKAIHRMATRRTPDADSLSLAGISRATGSHR
jgi:hypothetical protein